MLDRLTANLQFQGQALALRAERQQVLAANIANADTPAYQARDFDFGRALRQATGQVTTSTVPGGAALPRLALALPGATNGTATGAPANARQPGPTDLAWRVPEQPSIDGNTVDLDRERANFADNSLRYEATLRFINGGVRNLLSAIRGE